MLTSESSFQMKDRDYSDHIPEKQKDKEWCKYHLNKIIDAFHTYRTGRNGFYSDLECYKNWRGIRNSKDHEYLTKMYGEEYPAKLRHFPLNRPFANRMIGDHRRRPFLYEIAFRDTDSINQKKEEISQAFIEDIINNIVHNYVEAAADEQYQKTGVASDQIQELKNKNTEEKIADKLEAYKSNFKTRLEIAVKKLYDNAVDNLRVKFKINKQLKHQVITGKQYYKVYIETIGHYPKYDPKSPLSLVHPDEDVEDIQECTWVVERELISPTEVIKRYGHKMTNEERKNVEEGKFTYTFDYGADTYFNASDSNYESGEEYGYGGSSPKNLVSIYHGEWKSNEKITIEEDDFGIFDDEIVDGKTKKKKKEYRYKQNLFVGTRIGEGHDAIFVDIGKYKYPQRDPRNPSRVFLNYGGKLYDAEHNPPYSIIRETQHLQDLYDILFYKAEELIILSGVKGFTIFQELIPSEMKLSQWQALRKRGTNILNISGEDVKELLAYFSQLQSFDDTLNPQSISAIDGLIQRIEKIAGDIWGINPQALGNIEQYETSGNVNQAITQSSISTEPIFYAAEEAAYNVLNKIMNAMVVSFREGGITAGYMLNEIDQATLKLLNDKFSLATYNVILKSSWESKKKAEELKAASMQMIQAQQIDALDMFTIIMEDNPHEIYETLKNSVQKQKELLQQQSQQGQNSQKEQAEIQIKQQQLQSDIEEKAKRLKLDEQKFVNDKEISKKKLELDERKVSVDERQLDLYNQEILLEARTGEKIGTPGDKVVSRKR